MGKEVPAFFPADLALEAMGNTSSRWQNHLDTGKIHIPDGVSLVSSHGPGRGKRRQFPLETIAQGAVAFALIDAGVDVREAYRIGANLVYLGTNRPLGFDHDAPPDPALDRDPGRLFAEGETYLIYAVGEVAPHEDRFAIVSDANPAFRAVAPTSALSCVIGAVGGDDDAPRIVLNLSDICRRIADALCIPFTAAFVTGVR
ncbi:MAG: hypothetical protein ACK5MY_15690 [Jhaorihella sp.]